MAEPKSEETLGKGRFADSTMPDLAPAEAPAAAGANQAVVLEVDSTSFTSLVERSTKVPVVLVLTAPVSVPSLELAKLMEVMVRAYDGQLLLGKIDLQANPAIAEALQIQAVPTVMALINGRAVPLFQGQAEAEQIKKVLDQVLEAAAAAGVTGSVAGAGTGGAAAAAPVPPLHQAGFDAIEAGDLAGAREAFTKALSEAPADSMAKAAL
ncbi:MAG: thioredoxin domain-containing protein, partial [Micrococcales bacterium]|nr:thioredoxin domain-containing protein [Micrococcales bacterium]